MRTPRNNTPASCTRRPRRKPKGALSIAPSDVLWWASINHREPFVTTARLIKQARREVEVWWLEDNTMQIEPV